MKYKKQQKLYDADGNEWVIKELWPISAKVTCDYAKTHSFRLNLTLPYAVLNLFHTKQPKQ